MIEQLKSALSRLMGWHLSWRLLTLLPAALLLGGLSACSTTRVSYPIPPAKCSERVPASLKKDTPGWPFPATDTAQDWQAFGVGESGQRVQANNRAVTIVEIVATCEAREVEIYQALTKKKKK